MRTADLVVLDVAIRTLHLGEDLTDELLSPAQRSALEARRRSLAVANRCGTRAELAGELMDIRLVMGSSERLTPEQSKRKFDLEILDLSDVPFWAVVEAAAAYRRGDINDGKYRPRTGQLRKEAMRLARPFIEEAARIERVLLAPVAPVRPPAERKANLQKLSALLAELTVKSA
jgi:hypothetical protein